MIIEYGGQMDDPASAPLTGQPNSRPRILVVEDDAAIRHLNTLILTNSGYEVDAAEDGASAWEALQLRNYDLVVTDNKMPKVTGVELIQKLHAGRLAVPVILAAGTMPDTDFAGNHPLQPALTLLKPYTFERFLAAVRTVLAAASGSMDELTPPPNWERPPAFPGLRA